MDVEKTIDDVARFMQDASLDDLRLLLSALESRLGMMSLVSFPNPFQGHCECHDLIFDGMRIDRQKIEVIKTIRALTNKGLKESKDISEGMNVLVMTYDSYKEADSALTRLYQAGAMARIVTRSGNKV